MPIPGLSLVGFMNQADAIEHFRKANTRTDPDAALIADWQAAQAQLGAAIAGAGNPGIQAIPASHAAYIQQLIQMDWMQEALQGVLQGCQFQMVEIQKLLAFQTTVSLNQCNTHGAGLANPPTLDQQLHLCLPLNPPPPKYKVTYTPGQPSMLIHGDDLNIVPHGGYFNFQVPMPNNAPPVQLPPVAGFIVGARLPVVHVVVYNGRHYLHNGFHRVYALGRAGATHVPCVIRQVTTPGEAGINPPGTFSEARLTSNNPPTVGHYLLGRAFNVQLRTFAKALHVSWGEHVYPAE